MTKINKFKIIKEHSFVNGEECSCRIYCFKEIYFGNYVGNIGKHANYYQWLLFVCNNPDCDFQIALAGNYLDEIINSLIGLSKT